MLNLLQIATGSTERHGTSAINENVKSRTHFSQGILMARKDTIQEMQEVLMMRRSALRMAQKGDFSMLEKMSHESAGDVVDFAINSSNAEINSQLAEVENRELASIEIALEKMKDNTYGQCEACDKKIPLARLQALPYATLCIDCQREAENQDSAAAHPANWGKLGEIQSDADLNLS